MNKQRFIERLNLYLDNELPEEEVGPLLEEIRSNEEYKRLYREYRLIQCAVAQLGEDFGERREAISPWRQKVYAIGGMAAAVALLALAAQNLSPLINSDGEGLNPVSISKARSVNEAQGAPSFVASGANASSEIFFEGNEIDFASPFESRVKPFSVAGDVTYARFESETGKAVSPSFADLGRVYSFDQAIDASTFQHEQIMVEESKLELNFGGSSKASASEGSIRFDVIRPFQSVKEDSEKAAASARLKR